MSVLVPIGDFSRMTHLSVKALRFYHDQGLLEPARIDPATFVPRVRPRGALDIFGCDCIDRLEVTSRRRR